jgi:DNA-binding HxlR family transcriptional regulator
VSASDPSATAGSSGPSCCPYYHEAIELLGRRWTGAIVDILMQSQALRFSQIAAAVPALSDRLLSARMKELEARGLVVRRVMPGPPVRVEYSLTGMGSALGPALGELKRWAREWMDDRPTGRRSSTTGSKSHTSLATRPGIR